MFVDNRKLYVNIVHNYVYITITIYRDRFDALLGYKIMLLVSINKSLS